MTANKPPTAVSAADVAVIIVNYNAGIYLGACLEALLALPEMPGEIIVVDNASDDGSLESAREKFEQARFIEAGRNSGFAAANNLGIAATELPWVALVNPDAFVDRNWLRALLEALRENPRVAALSSELIDANNHARLDGRGDCYHVSGLVWRRKHGQAVDSLPSHLPFFAPCAASAMYLRSALLEVGGFDEDYFCYIEDVDLGFRLRLAGYACVHVHTALSYHIGSGITERESDFSVYHGHRNLVWTYFKNMPTVLLWLYLPQHLLMNLLSLLYYTLRGRPRVIFRAKWHALKGLRAQIGKRKAQVSAPGIDVRAAMARGWLTPYLRRYD